MARYSVAQTKDNLSALIERARSGEEVVITNRGKPVARIASVAEEAVDCGTALQRLREGIAAIGGINLPVSGANFRDWLYEDYKF